MESMDPIIGQYCMVYGDGKKALATFANRFIWMDEAIENIEYWSPIRVQHKIIEHPNGEDIWIPVDFIEENKMYQPTNRSY